MKKHFFYLAIAALTALSLTACSSDDDSSEAGNENPINLPAPVNASQAVRYSMRTALVAISTTLGDIADAPVLRQLDITESGKVLVEFSRPNDSENPIFMMENVSVNNGVYTFNGSKMKGTVTVVESRATGTERLLVSLVATFSREEIVTYDNGDEPVTVTTTTTSTGDEATDRLCRTWNVLGAILDLKSDRQNVKAYEEFDSRGGLFYMEDVLEEALRQDVRLTEEEQEEFKRVIKSITITKSGKFSIDYADGTEDVADWEWANAEKTAFTIKMNGEDMGNKFLSDDSRITVAYKDNRCNLKLDTQLNDKDDNDWAVILTLRLQA